jgi:hypothetical protein
VLQVRHLQTELQALNSAAQSISTADLFLAERRRALRLAAAFIYNRLHPLQPVDKQ